MSESKQRLREVEPEKKPVYVTRRGVMTIGAVIGFTQAIVIVLVAISLIRLGNEIHKRSRSDHQVREIASQVLPSKHQLDERVLKVLHRCETDPDCKALFQRVASSKKKKGKSDNTLPPKNQTGSTNSTGDNDVQSQTSATSASSPSRTSVPTRSPSPAPAPTPSSGSTSSGTPGSSSQPTPPAKPSPVLNVPAPIVPPLCIDDLVGVNC